MRPPAAEARGQPCQRAASGRYFKKTDVATTGPNRVIKIRANHKTASTAGIALLDSTFFGRGYRQCRSWSFATARESKYTANGVFCNYAPLLFRNLLGIHCLLT